MRLSAGEVIAAMERLPIVTFEQLATRGLVVVAPHPDDESLGCGGLIAAAAQRSIPVRIVVVSDGVGSHPNSRSYPPERLRRLREGEAIAAAAELGVPADAVLFLRLPDRSVPSSGPDADDAVAKIVAAAEACGADLMTVTWPHDPHCDHEAAFALTFAARRKLPRIRLLAYPIWGFVLSPERMLDTEMPRGFRLDIGSQRAAKRRAVAAHRSQTGPLIDDDPEGFVLSEADLARFDRPFETYVEVRA